MTPDSHPGAFQTAGTNGDPCLLAEEVTKRGGVFRGEEWGEGVISSYSSSSSSSSLSSPEDLGSKGVSSHRTLTAIRVTLLSHLLCFRAYCLSLSTRLASHLTISSGKVTPRGALHAYPRSYIRTRMC
jgi:hypothetical protein